MLTFVAALFGLAGCQPADPIKVQDARRLNAMQRCLGAVVFPQSERSSKIWVFRVIGPEHTLDQFKPAFEDFVLRGGVFCNERKEVEWKLPQNWKNVTEKKGCQKFGETAGQPQGRQGTAGNHRSRAHHAQANRRSPERPKALAP